MKIPVHASSGPLVAALCCLLAGCSSPPDDGAPIAEIAGRSVFLADFQPVLERYASEGEFSDAVKSRLLDQFLDERVLQEEAERRGIQVDENVLDRAMASLGAEAGPHRRDEIRATLQVQQLIRIILEETAPVTAEEEESYYQDHADEFRQPARIQVRQILLDASSAAAEVHAQVIQEPERFGAIAASHSTSPDHGRSLVYDFDELPTEVSLVLKDLKVGTISPVIEMKEAGYQWIFLIENVQEQRSLSLEEARPEIRSLLQEQKGNGAMTRLMADLKAGLGLRLHPENLPFRYVEEESA